MYIPTCMYEYTCIHLYERLCMHTYILREGRRNSRRGKREGRGSFISQLNRGGCGSQAAFESLGPELGTAVVEKLMLEIQSLLLGCGSKAGHGRSRCSLIQSKLKSSLPWQTQPFPLRQTKANQCYFSGSAQLRRECHCVHGWS